MGLALCFVGHGALAIAKHPPWTNFYRAVGLDEMWALGTMPLVGALDMVVALVLVIRPPFALLVWCLVWTVFTALLRPLSGLGAEEVLVRAMNFGPALILLAIARGASQRAQLALVCCALALTCAGALLGARLVPQNELWARWMNAAEWIERGGLVGLVIAGVALALGRPKTARSTATP